MIDVRELCRGVLREALAAADPGTAVARALRVEHDALRAGQHVLPLAAAARVIVVGAGKGAGAMARAAEQALGARLAAGVVVAPHGGPPAELQRIELLRAAHPTPDEHGMRAARRLLDAVAGLGAEDLVLVLLSGGASALLSLPRPGLALDDLQRASDALLRGGVPIAQLNAVRRHLGQLGGGQLAAAAAPARVVSLILSDVVGDALEAIGSGPTVADPTTFADALAVIEGSAAAAQLPHVVRDYLRAGAAGAQPETLKPGDARLARATSVLVGSNRLAAQAAVAAARRAGWNAALLTDALEGEARVVGGVLGALLREAAQGELFRRPFCLVAGGETTVTVRGCGRGGRNQELALAAARKLDGVPRVLLASCATDGVDGPTDAAGALVDGETIARGRALGRAAEAHLRDNDAYPYLEAVGDLLRSGPSGTNVNDLCLLCAW